MAVSEHFELLESVSPAIRALMDDHRQRREHWYAHEVVPWEKGRNFREDPWDESQCTISPEARTSLVLNLLTEDNLPYYHAEIEAHSTEHEVLSEWTHLWTAEEGQHAIAIRSYLLTTRNCDPRELEDDRLATMEAGFSTGLPNPVAIFAYTAAQELATRVSHRNAGKITDDEVAYELMTRIAADENHHFMFYRGAISAMLEQNASAVLPEIYRVLSDFKMPGIGMPKYLRRAVEMAKAGVYNMRIHHDRVLQPLLRDWKIESLTGLTTAAQEIQEKIMEIPAVTVRQAEAFERRYKLATG
ncbi:MAG: acyl-ACP desaturase [Acidimicrobiia bacterium]|nr:acyl-ACP desaturase [Acidimicrobiia bacterium]